MLKHHIGEGMWTVLSEGEQHERFIQLKMRVQRLRKDDKLDGADGLPGAGALYSATLLALMGLSRIGEENQRLEEAEKIKQMEKEGQFYQLVFRYFTLFEADFISSLMFIFRFTVEPRYNERPRGWQNLFTITRFRYVKVLFHIFFYYWGKENCSLYRALLRCIEVRYIEVPLYFHAIAQKNKRTATI